MAKGKIIYTPLASQALSLPGGQWLAIDQEVFNFGADPFNLGMLVYLDPAVQPDAEAWLLGKGAPALPHTWADYPQWLAVAQGLILSYVPRYNCLKMVLNDGQEYPALYMSPENSIPEAGWYWLGVSVPRNVDPVFYINKVPFSAIAGAGDFPAGDLPAGGSPFPADYPGNLDNAEPLRVGGYDGLNWRFVGKIDFIRMDYGRTLPAAWYAEEWERVRYGYPRNTDLFKGDCLAVWTFPGDLADEQAGYELALNGGGSPVYVSGWPYGPMEVSFEHNYKYEFAPGYLSLDDKNRALDGSFQAYAQAVKRQSIRLPFEGISFAQKTALTAAHLALSEVGLFLDADHRRTCRGIIPEPPEVKGMPNFRDGEQIWDAGEVEVQSL